MIFLSKKIQWLYKYSLIYKIPPLSTQRKGWSTEEEAGAVLVCLFYYICFTVDCYEF